MSLDDFPIRDENSELATEAEVAFECEIENARHFVVQQRDRRDYGTDFQVEASQSGAMTNFRVHIQLKGTDKFPNKDGSISLSSIARTNLNYMLSQPNSIYVCYHAPTEKLYVRSAGDVFREYEHTDEEWRSQETLTVRFRNSFDAEFQSKLQARVVASSVGQRDYRLDWAMTTPEDFSKEVSKKVPAIVVPESPEEAFAVLESLYTSGKDAVISKAFQQFEASFSADDPRLSYAYLAEINLAMHNKSFSHDPLCAKIA